MKAVEFSKVWEKYHIKFIKEQGVCWEEVWALKDISFCADKGEVLGIIGENGSGKTTLLKLISGMLVSDKGEVKVNGRVSALMELGAGFKPEFSGRENIKLNARAYGLDEEGLDKQIEKIIEFADIGRFIDAPIKYYSQGMYARLAFALAIFVEPDILLIDDIMAVGDEEAQQKCVKKIFELKASGKTIVLVSHDMSMINKLCGRVLLVENGGIVKEGQAGRITSYYLETVGDKKGIAVVEEGKTRLVFNNGRLSLSRDGVFITKDMGIYTVFFDSSCKGWFFSHNLYWSIKQQSQEEFIAEGRDSKGELFQTWQVCLKNESLNCQVQINSPYLKEARLEMSLVPEYKTCASLTQDFDFPPITHKSSWQEIGPKDFPESLLGMYSDEELMPGIILKSPEGKPLDFKVFNTGYEKEARIIQAPLTKESQSSISLEIFPEAQAVLNCIRESRSYFKEKQWAEEEKGRIQRTISFGDFSLFADVDNKALRLYHKGKELTKKSGLHTSFLVGKAWSGTERANWQVIKEDNCLLVRFVWEEFNFTQASRLSFEDSALIWKSEYHAQSFKPPFLKIGLVVDEVYQSYFCGSQQADFPQEFSFWKDMLLEEPKAVFLGLRAAGQLAAVTLENKQNHSCIIQNSDEENKCRVLQLGLAGSLFNRSNFSFSAKIGLFEQEALIDEYVQKQKQELIAKQEEERKGRILNHTVSSGLLRLFADFESRSLRVYYDNREVTSGLGLCYTLISPKGALLSLSNAKWKVNKTSGSKLVLALEYESFPAVVIWSLECCPDSILNIDIELKSDENVILANQEVNLELCAEYEKWRTFAEGGSFFIDRYINEIGPIRLKDNKVSAIVLETGSQGLDKRITFECLSHLQNRILNIYRRQDEKGSYPGVYSSAIVPKKKQEVPSGRHTCFKGKMIFGRQVELKQDYGAAQAVVLSSNSLKFIFDRGKGRIFFNQNELTAGLGLYASIRSRGIWYDSYQAYWQLLGQENNRITLLGDWPHIPVSQEWQIELAGENLILWQAWMKIYEEFDLEIAQSNIMLSSRYKNWQAGDSSQGEFADEFTSSYDILPFRFFYGRVFDIKAKGQNLPRVIFKNKTDDDSFRAVAENTDSLYQARLIQHQKTGRFKSLSEKSLYFKGEIRVEL